MNPTSETNKLVTAGPNAITRDPMYLGLTVISLGLAFWVGSLPMFAVPVLAFAMANWVHLGEHVAVSGLPKPPAGGDIRRIDVIIRVDRDPAPAADQKFSKLY